MRRRINGSGPDEEDAIELPRRVARERSCDFCHEPPTTHWLTFKPGIRGLPGYLGACTSCAESLHFQNHQQLADESGMSKDEAKAIARGFKAIHPGSA
jgi:ferredoxin